MDRWGFFVPFPSGEKVLTGPKLPIRGGFLSRVFKRLVLFPVDGISTSSISCFEKIGTEAGNQPAAPRDAARSAQPLLGDETHENELLNKEEDYVCGHLQSN